MDTEHKPVRSVSDPARLNVTIIHDADKLDELADDWAGLFEHSAYSNVFMSWEWVSAWCETLGAARELWLVTARDKENDDLLVGVLPLVMMRRKRGPFSWQQLEIIGAKHGADHLGVLAREGYETVAAVACVRDLLAQRGRWFALELGAVAAEAPSWKHLRKAFSGWRIGLGDPCPCAELPDSWDVFHKQVLSQHQRKKQRRFRRNLDNAYPDQVAFWQVKTPEQLRRALDRLFELHRQKWDAIGVPSIFENEKLVRFHHVFARRALERGWLRTCVLEVAGEAVAVEYAIRSGDLVMAYQAAYDATWSEYSPGHLMTQHAIQQAIEEGVRLYDFLRGDEDYKYRWATGEWQDLIAVLPANRWAGLALDGIERLAQLRQMLKGGGRSEPGEDEDKDG